MINTMINIKNISFIQKEVDDAFLSSIEKRGVAIPVHVNYIDKDQYECVDGNKRLSACKILTGKDLKFERIPVMIMNNYSKAGSSFWGNTQNHH